MGRDYEQAKFWLREKYRLRKEQGLCVVCGKEKAVIGMTKCEACAEKNALYQRLRRLKQEHTEENKAKRENAKRLYAYRKEHHICVQCGFYEAEENSVSCSQCKAKDRERDKAWRKAKKKNANSKAKYQWLKEHHICVQCGQRDAIYGMVRCEVCLEYQALRQPTPEKKREYSKTNREQRVASGTCIYCDKPAVKGVQTCKYHRTARNAYNKAHSGYKRKCTDEELHKIRSECGKRNILIARSSPNCEKQRKQFREFHNLIFGRKGITQAE